MPGSVLLLRLMAYLGLVPREHSSGVRTQRGSLTKAGNGRLRRTLIESAWSYRHRPAIKGDLARRLEGLPADIKAHFMESPGTAAPKIPPFSLWIKQTQKCRGHRGGQGTDRVHLGGRPNVGATERSVICYSS
ncbi:transposase [Paenibacillus sp. FSL H7-0940]|uniref:transposase n=1 Tax=Paenibacillus sp. FSL H7-0940 TaxID=2921443 RepID=UPI0030ED1E49